MLMLASAACATGRINPAADIFQRRRAQIPRRGVYNEKITRHSCLCLYSDCFNLFRWQQWLLSDRRRRQATVPGLFKLLFGILESDLQYSLERLAVGHISLQADD
jgi:hypothetical protein